MSERTVSFEIRTRADRPVFAFDNVVRARQERTEAEKRLGIPLRLVRITRIEKEIA